MATVAAQDLWWTMLLVWVLTLQPRAALRVMLVRRLVGVHCVEVRARLMLRGQRGLLQVRLWWHRVDQWRMHRQLRLRDGCARRCPGRGGRKMQGAHGARRLLRLLLLSRALSLERLKPVALRAHALRVRDGGQHSSAQG